MKIMNEEGLMIEHLQHGEFEFDETKIESEFQERLQGMIQAYQGDDMAKRLDPTNTNELKISEEHQRSWVMQFVLLFARFFMHNLREPSEIRMKFVQQVIFSISLLIAFNDLGNSGQQAIQNRNGALFFLITIQCFAGFEGAIGTFSLLRPIFLRERLNKTYSTGSYFWGKQMADLPLDFLYPITSIVIIYYVIGLNDDDVYRFLILCAINQLTYICSSSYGLLVSVCISQLELAVAMVPAVIVPLMIFGGFFVNSNSLQPWIRWIEWLSMFKWGFQAAAINEFDGKEFDCQCLEVDLNDPQYLLIKQELGLEEDMCIPMNCDALQQHGFEYTLSETVIILAGLMIVLRLVALIGMYIISNPKRPSIKPPLDQQEFQALKDLHINK